MNQRLQAPLSELHESDAFARRHIGPSAPDEAHMLQAIGQPSRQALMDALVPPNIVQDRPMDLPPALTEAEALHELKTIAARNRVLKSFIQARQSGAVEETEPAKSEAEEKKEGK